MEALRMGGRLRRCRHVGIDSLAFSWKLKHTFAVLAGLNLANPGNKIGGVVTEKSITNESRKPAGLTLRA